jgi:hypothetical protein
MATTSTDPREIEADLERERAALATTLDTLSDRVSVDNLAKEALGMIKSHAGSATSSIDHVVRANPLAVALIGAGVAWMFLGNKVRGGSSSSDYGSGYGSGDYASSGSGAYMGSQTSSTGSSGSFASTGSSSSYGSSSFGGSSGSSDYGRVGYVASDNDDDHSWSRDAHGLRARAADALRRIEHEAKSYYDSLRSGLSNMTSGSGQSRDFDAERQSVISSFTSDLKTRFSAGLDNLPPEARDRVVAARERAYGAMLQAERMGRDVMRDPSRALEEHPIVAGTVAFALGAAAGAAFSSTDFENRTFGSERDKLLDEASRLLRQERERAMQIAGSLGQEIKAAAAETVEAVTDTVTDKASQAAHRVTDRASEEIRSGQQGGSGSSGSGMAGPGDPVIG